MSSLVAYGTRGVKVLSPTPSGAGGQGLNSNFQAIDDALAALQTAVASANTLITALQSTKASLTGATFSGDVTVQTTLLIGSNGEIQRSANFGGSLAVGLGGGVGAFTFFGADAIHTDLDFITSGNITAATLTGLIDSNQVTGLGSAALLNANNAANQVPLLDGSGKLASSVIPPLAIAQVSVVGSQAEMVALSAQRGDVAVRTDVSKTFILSTDDPTSRFNWIELLGAGESPVQSVNGLQGTVVLTKADVGLSNVANVDQTNAANLTSGTIGTARLGSGTANNTKFLRGDSTWQTLNLAAIADWAAELTAINAALAGRLPLTGGSLSNGLTINQNGSSFALELIGNGDPDAEIFTVFNGGDGPLVSIDPSYNFIVQNQLVAGSISAGSAVITGVCQVSGRVTSGSIAGAYASTFHTDATLGNQFNITLTGHVTLANPTNSVDGQTITWRLKQDATGGRGVSLDTAFNDPASTIAHLQLSPSGCEYISAIYNAGTSKWDVMPGTGQVY